MREAKEDVKVRQALIKMNKEKTVAWRGGEVEDERAVASTTSRVSILRKVSQAKDVAAHKEEDEQR